MSGPYNFEYLIPEIKIPTHLAPSAPMTDLPEANDWLDENFANLNCNMKNPYTGAPCFSDNSSILSVLLTGNFRHIEDMKILSGKQIWLAPMEEADRPQIVVTDDNGNANLHIGPHYKPEVWYEPQTVIDEAQKARDMFLDQDPRLIDQLGEDIDIAIGDIELNEFLPADEQASEDCESDLTSEDEMNQRVIALMGASGCATIAIEAEKYRERGAGKITFVSANEVIGFEEPTNQRTATGRAGATAKKGWLPRLLGN